jgi:hypothetical protein
VWADLAGETAVPDDGTTGTPWLRISPVSGNTQTNEMVLEMDANESGAERTAYIHITAGRFVYPVKVTQTTVSDFSLRVLSASQDITEMVFISSIGTAPASQMLTVNWQPVDGDLVVTSTGTDFAGAPASGTVNNGMGTISYTITPSAIQPEELTADPFLEKTSQLTFTVTRGASVVTKSVTIRQTAYNLVPGNFDGLLDTSPQNQTITIRSNFPWVVSAISDIDNILQNDNNLMGLEREANTGLGSLLALVLQSESYYASKNGKTAVITVESRIDNSTWDIPITIVEPLYVGRFGGELKQHADGKYRFERTLYIQGRDQHGFYAWGPETETTNVNDRWDGKGNTLALYNLSNNYPAAETCFTKNVSYTSINNVTDANYRWYLPAQKQLLTAWISYNSFDAAYRPSQPGYRSATESTENKALYAWVVAFNRGLTSYTYKGNNNYYRVRCIREGN